MVENLPRLFELRATADYAKLTDVTKLQAEKALSEAKEFVSWTRQWLIERQWTEK